MRKLFAPLSGLVLLAAAGTALAGAPAVNSNGDFIDLSVKVTPPMSSTATVKRSVGVTFDSFTGNRINANQTTNENALSVHFGQNFVSNGLLFPACKINPTALSVCPGATKVGSGTAEGELLSSTGGAPTYVPATLAAYNGKPYLDKHPTLIIIATVGGKPATELDFRLAPQGGGLTLSEIMFPSTGPSAGPTIYLTKFHLVQPARSETRVSRGKRVTIPLLVAPTVCKGSWTFSQTLGYPHQAPLTATDSQPCVKG